jgi:hypothetical protein
MRKPETATLPCRENLGKQVISCLRVPSPQCGSSEENYELAGFSRGVRGATERSSAPRNPPPDTSRVRSSTWHSPTQSRMDGAPAGSHEKVIMQASKNGFFYVLDRQTGQFISAKAFVNGITWATGINPETGRPQEWPSAHNGWQAVLVSPSPGGGHNWYPMAFHPATGLVYVPARENSVFLSAPDKNWKSNPTLWNRGEDAAYDGPVRQKALASPPVTGHLIAWNPVEQHEAWRADLPLVESGGVLATGGNLVFQGRSDGIICVYRATDGKKLWEFDAGTGIMAPPVTYLRDGVQYVTLMVGWGGSRRTSQSPRQRPGEAGLWPCTNFFPWRQCKAGSSAVRTYRASVARDPHERHRHCHPRRQHFIPALLHLLPWSGRCLRLQHS